MKNAGRTSAASRVVIVAATVVAGAAVRWIGIGHGAPSFLFHPDVAKQAIVARAAYRGEPSPTVYFKGDTTHRLYPYGAPVLLGSILRGARGLGLYEAAPGATETEDRWLWGYRLRVFSAAVFLAAAVAATLSLASRVGAVLALATGLLLVLEPRGVEYAHYGMNDVPLTAMLLVAWVAAGAAAAGARVSLHAVICGLALGVGFGVKYQALLGAVFPAAAAWRLWRDGRGRVLVGSGAAFTAAWSLGAIVSSPLLLEHAGYFAQEFPRFMEWQTNITGRDLPLVEKLLRNLPRLAHLLASGGGWLLLPAVVWGSARTLRPNGSPREWTWIASGAAFVVVLAAVVVFSRDLVRPNDVVPLLPFPVLLSALWLGGQRRAYRLAGAAAALVLIGVFAGTSIADAVAFSRPDTRERARQWCRQHLPSGTRLLRERYVLSVDRPGIGEVVSRDLTSEEAREAIERRRYDVVITSSLAHDRYFDPTSPEHDSLAQDVYRRLAAGYRVLAEFRDRRLDFAHPRITIYGRPEALPPAVTSRPLSGRRPTTQRNPRGAGPGFSKRWTSFGAM